jgi:hypothetical protein
MKFTTPARRVLAASAVSALAAGALVTTTTTSASAAPIANEYLCDASTDFPLFLNSDIPIIAAVEANGIGAGYDVPAEFLEIANTVTVPTAVLDTLSGLGITRVDAPGFAGTFGGKTIGVDGVGAEIATATENDNGTSTFQADGVNSAFEVPAAGTYDVVSPETISLQAKNSSGTVVTTVNCVLAEGETAGSYATVGVYKNDSTSNAKTTKRQFKKGTAAAVRVKVLAENETPSGKVLLKKGTKTLAKANLNDNGVAVLKTKALRVGKTKLTTVYKGDAYTKPSKDTVIVKVVR